MGWSEGAVCALLEAYRDKSLELNKGNCRPRDWQEIVTRVNNRGDGKGLKSVKQCRDKLDNLKRKFKTEKEKQEAVEGAPSKWQWYAAMEGLVGSSARFSLIPGAMDGGMRRKSMGSPELDNDRIDENLGHADESIGVAAATSTGKEPLSSVPHSPGASPPPSSEQDNTPERDGNWGGVEVNGPRSKNPKSLRVSSKAIKKTKRHKSSSAEGPLRELAASIKGFGELYAKIELTKLECMSALEKAKGEQLAAMEKHRGEVQLELVKMFAGIYTTFVAKPPPHSASET